MKNIFFKFALSSMSTIGLLTAGCSAPSAVAKTPVLSNSVSWNSAECAPEPITQTPFVANLKGENLSVKKVDTYIDRKMEKLKIAGTSIAIINDGKVVYHRTKGVKNSKTGETVNGCTIFQGASITKPLFAYFTMTFVEDKSLDLDKPLYEYLPYPDIAHDERYKKITARMALNHQTGFPNWRTDYEDKKLFIKFDPGTDVEYSGEGYQYLSLVLQEIAGVDHAGLEALFQERVATPLGMRHTKIIPDERLLSRIARPHNEKRQLVKVTTSVDPNDFGAAYGVHSEALDFSKWLIALMNQDGLSGESFDKFFTLQNSPKKPSFIERRLGQVGRSLGFVVYDIDDGRIYGHDGNNPGYSSLIALDKDKKWGVVVFSNANQRSRLGRDIVQFLNK